MYFPRGLKQKMVTGLSKRPLSHQCSIVDTFRVKYQNIAKCVKNCQVLEVIILAAKHLAFGQAGFYTNSSPLAKDN
jgi:hypothetical protein